MKKKVMMSVMAAVMMLSGSITALAAPEVISVNGNNTVFDWEYYANTYPDVTAELGTSREAMIQHYVSFGQRENREAYAAGTDAAAILAAYQEGNPASETIVPVQTEKKQLLRVDEYLNGELYSSASYEYDAQGNLIKEIDSDGWTYEYSYDNQGNLIKEIRYSEYVGSWESTFIYDNSGNVIREESRGLGEYCADSITTYSYDSQGNLINEVCDVPDADYENYIKTYSYDSQGNLINEVSLCVGYDSTMKTYSYDNRGNCVQMVMTYLYDDGTPYEDEEPEYFSYTYDEYGNLIKEVCNDGRGTTVAEYRNTYAN